MKFDILSPREDFKSKLQISKLDIMQKNILYLTHEMDKCVSMLKQLQTNARLQKQVDEYFEETSPQTEQTTNDDSTRTD